MLIVSGESVRGCRAHPAKAGQPGPRSTTRVEQHGLSVDLQERLTHQVHQ